MDDKITVHNIYKDGEINVDAFEKCITRLMEKELQQFIDNENWQIWYNIFILSHSSYKGGNYYDFSSGLSKTVARR